MSSVPNTEGIDLGAYSAMQNSTVFMTNAETQNFFLKRSIRVGLGSLIAPASRTTAQTVLYQTAAYLTIPYQVRTVTSSHGRQSKIWQFYQSLNLCLGRSRD